MRLETGKRKTTDYVARQYIGNLGKTENGIVSVNTWSFRKHNISTDFQDIQTQSASPKTRRL